MSLLGRNIADFCGICFATLSGMPFKLAFMTVGILREPVGHAQVQGFVDRIGDVYAAASPRPGSTHREIRHSPPPPHTRHRCGPQNPSPPPGPPPPPMFPPS